jgi:HEAT repeat protein
MLKSKSAAAVPFLIPMLGDEAMAWSPSIFIPYTGSPVAGEAIDALAAIGPPAVGPLTVALKNAVPAVRARAAVCLGRIGDARAVDALLVAAEDPNGHVKRAARAALACIPEARAVPYAMSVLQDNRNTRDAYRSIIALGHTGPAARPAAPLLWDVFRDGKNSDRWRAATALGRIEQGGPIVTELVKAANERSADSHESDAIDALGWMGPSARQAVPDLKGMLSEDHVANRAAIALWRITSDPSVCLGPLQECCADYDSCECLAEMGPLAAPAVPALIEALRIKNDIPHGAVRALGRIGPAAKEAVPALCECLKEKLSYGLRTEAAEALGRIGPAASPAIPALKELLRDNFWQVRVAAEDALELIQSGAGQTSKR